jgi:hypothetical protein
MSREFLMIVAETTFKTPEVTPVVYPTTSPTAYYVRLDGANAFSMRPQPVMVTVPYGGGVAIDAFRVADKLECKGRLVTKLYAGNATAIGLGGFLLNWATTPINSGRTAPWVTDAGGEPVGDLASIAIYHAITRSDGTIKRRVYLGCKCDGYDLDVSEDGTIATLSLDITGSTPQGNQWDSSTDPTAGTFPAESDSQLPTNPYLFTHCSGGLTIGTARTQFQSVKLSVKNVLARRFWANRFAQLLRYVGRSVTLEAQNYYVPTPDDRTGYEGILGFATTGGYTGTTVTFELNNSVHTVIYDFKTNSVITTLADNLPLNDLYTQTMTVTSQWDTAAATDLTLALT